MAFKMNPGRGEYAKTGRDIPKDMVSPLKMFPIKPSTKLQKGEAVLVKGPGGRTFKASSVKEAMGMRSKFREAAAPDTSLTAVTEVSPGVFTEQRRDPQSSELRTEKQEISLARSKKDPKPSVKSKEATLRKKDYASTFGLKSTKEEGTPVGKAYDRVYNSPNKMKKYNKKK